jgi:hypothetical protein
MKCAAATLKVRRRLNPPETDKVHPHHHSLAQTMACGKCMRHFWEAQGLLERLVPASVTHPASARTAAGSELFRVVG